MDALCRWFFGRRRADTVVTQVIAFNLGPPNDGVLQYLSWDPDAFAGTAWEDHVHDVTGYSRARLEIRLFERGRKRRVLLHPGDSCDPSFELPDEQRQRVVYAILVPEKDSDARVVDVTKRVQKYIHNRLNDATDMFPFDDPDDLRARFAYVRVTDLRLVVRCIPMRVPAAEQ